MVPAQLQRVLDDASTMAKLDQLMQSFERILVGGQSIPQSLIERSRPPPIRSRELMAPSETAGGCVWDGHAIGETSVAEFDGRIALSGPTLAHSYLDDPERTARSFVDREGSRWYLSDDAGSVDERGRLTIQGRLDDVIVSGGVKVALGRIERLVHRDFSAPDAVVVGAEHETWGHVPVVVTTKNLDLTAVRLGIGAELGPEARPDRVLTIPEIPLLPSGKPDRLALTALAGQGH